MTQFEKDMRMYEQYMQRAKLMGTDGDYEFAVSKCEGKIYLKAAKPNKQGVVIIPPFVSDIQLNESMPLIPKRSTKVKIICEHSRISNLKYLFVYCDALTEVDLSSFNMLNVTTMYGMFWSCMGLKKVILSHTATPNLTTTENMFFMCRALETIEFNAFYTANVTSMHMMFAMCNSFRVLDLSSFITSKVRDMVGMFSDCLSLQSINLSSFDTHNVIDMHSMFANCKSLKALDLQSFETINCQHIQHMFYSCKSMVSLDIRNFTVTERTIARHTFTDCNALRYVYISDYTAQKLLPSNKPDIEFKYMLFSEFIDKYALTEAAAARLLEWKTKEYKGYMQNGLNAPLDRIALLTSLYNTPYLMKRLLEDKKDKLTAKQYYTSICITERLLES